MKIIKTIIILIILLFSSLVIYIYNSGPVLPANTDLVIDEVINQPMIELVKGKSGYSDSNGVKIWYESIGEENKEKGTILLIMGIATDAIGWPLEFISQLVNKGYHVVRFDNRGVGMSDWIENWDKNNPYSLSDMALDAKSVLKSLNIDKAHVLGVSMGGMIAQEFAINHIENTASLISVMSSGNIMDSELPPISKTVAFELVKQVAKYGIIKTDKNLIKLFIAVRKIIMGDTTHDWNIEEIARIIHYNSKKRRGYNFNSSAQQQAAVMLSGSRYQKLENLNIPALIIHGKMDPFIPIEHSKKLARIIPNADSLWIDNLGHDLFPPEFIIGVSSKLDEYLTKSSFMTNSNNKIIE